MANDHTLLPDRSKGSDSLRYGALELSPLSRSLHDRGILQTTVYSAQVLGIAE